MIGKPIACENIPLLKPSMGKAKAKQTQMPFVHPSAVSCALTEASPWTTPLEPVKVRTPLGSDGASPFAALSHVQQMMRPKSRGRSCERILSNLHLSNAVVAGMNKDPKGRARTLAR